jgi:hypothetical protein
MSLVLVQETSLQYEGSIISGGESGDVEGIGTYAAFKSISGIALQYNGASDNEIALYVADVTTNKINQVELISGLYSMSTFASGVDVFGNNLKGVAVYENQLFCGVAGGIVVFNLTVGPTSKRMYAGHAGGRISRVK